MEQTNETKTAKSQIIIVQDEKDGLAKPYFCCGHCGKVIKDASEANLVWDPEKPEETTVICKMDVCEKAQELREGGDCWQPLDATWYYLKINGKINMKEAKHTADLLMSI